MAGGTEYGRRAAARFLDGRVLKGIVLDFAPWRETFHLAPREGPADEPIEVEVAQLKAIFFVKSWDGNPDRADEKSFERAAGQGQRVIVTFLDDEILPGFTVGYDAHKPGFFVVPADRGSNNARVFVVAAAVKSLEWVEATTHPAFPARRVV